MTYNNCKSEPIPYICTQNAQLCVPTLHNYNTGSRNFTILNSELYCIGLCNDCPVLKLNLIIDCNINHRCTLSSLSNKKQTHLHTQLISNKHYQRKTSNIPNTSSRSFGFSHFSPSLMIFLNNPPSLQMSLTLTQERSSTSNCRVALGGMVGGEPDSPYASSAGMVKRAFSPFFIVLIPRSHPLITCPIITKSRLTTNK